VNLSEIYITLGNTGVADKYFTATVTHSPTQTLSRKLLILKVSFNFQLLQIELAVKK
jgi:hypothetical protein